MAYISGHSIGCKLGATSSTLLLVKGLETAKASFSPEYGQILVKSMEGKPEDQLEGGKLTISLGGKMSSLETGDSTTMMDYTTVRTAAKAGTNMYFSYGTGTSDITGVGKIKGYDDDSDSKKSPASWSATLEVYFDDID